MYKSKRIIAIVPTYNEEGRIARVVERTDFRLVDHLLVVDDASTDRTAEIARGKGADVLTLPRRSGVGA
ncbi:MAG: glycosyltransferase, partial [Planctomycetes bacterium]|nr:glycosyltransferase [Planctomycetota bacterium]